MKTIRTKVYQFSELSDSAKQEAINWYLNYADQSFPYDDTVEDAEQIGLNITCLNDYRPNKGTFENSAAETAEAIVLNHGEHCETYKTAKSFLNALEALTGSKEDIADVDSDKIEELEDEFLQSMLEDYRIMYNANVEYQQSDKYAIENIEANEYDFTADGKRFNQ